MSKRDGSAGTSIFIQFEKKVGNGENTGIIERGLVIFVTKKFSSLKQKWGL